MKWWLCLVNGRLYKGRRAFRMTDQPHPSPHETHNNSNIRICPVNPSPSNCHAHHNILDSWSRCTQAVAGAQVNMPIMSVSVYDCFNVVINVDAIAHVVILIQYMWCFCRIRKGMNDRIFCVVWIMIIAVDIWIYEYTRTRYPNMAFMQTSIVSQWLTNSVCSRMRSLFRFQ